jgi:hypothetical protein
VVTTPKSDTEALRHQSNRTTAQFPGSSVPLLLSAKLSANLFIFTKLNLVLLYLWETFIFLSVLAKTNHPTEAKRKQ